MRALTTPESKSTVADKSAAAAVVAQATPQQQAPDTPEPSVADVKQAARQLEQFMQSMNRYLEFRIDTDSGRTVVTVRDKTTGDTVRQIPTEEVLRLAQNLGGKTGSLLSQSA
jgi:flagellar protein FlaG